MELGREFRNHASPTEDQLRHLLYLAEQDNGSVLTAGAKSPGAAGHDRRKDAERTAEFEQMQLARLADPEYQAMSARINSDLDAMDEQSIIMLQEIEYALAELSDKRAKMLEEAYRDDQGLAMFIAEDGSAAYYEDGSQVDDETFIQVRDKLEDGPTHEKFLALGEREDALNESRDRIHEGMDAGNDLREDLATGAISQEEAEHRAQEIASAQTDALNATEEAIFAARGEHAAANGLDRELDQPELTAPQAPTSTPAPG